MNIWIDIANAPHVPFFLPIIRRLKGDGHEVSITFRDFNFAVELAEKYGLAGVSIGTHGGRGRFHKIGNLTARAWALAKYASGRRFDIAVSHNSYPHVLAGRLIGVRTVTLMDYEGQPANHIAFRFADKIIVPRSFPDRALRRFGARSRKVYKYDGYKEQVYLSDFHPAATFLDEFARTCHLPSHWRLADTVMATIRTPATMAAYHCFESPLYESLLRRIDRMSDVTVVVLCRNEEQKEHIHTTYRRLLIPQYPLDGSNLVYHSDLVISAGGTMNREAAVLGTPAYSIFAGAFPAVDTDLMQKGRLSRITSEREVCQIRFAKKSGHEPLRNPGLCDEIVQQILC